MSNFKEVHLIFCSLVVFLNHFSDFILKQYQYFYVLKGSTVSPHTLKLQQVIKSHPHQSNGLKCPLPEFFSKKLTVYWNTQNKLPSSGDVKEEQLPPEESQIQKGFPYMQPVSSFPPASTLGFFGSLPLTGSLSVYHTDWPSAPTIWLHSSALSRIFLSSVGWRETLSRKMLAWKPCGSWGCGKSPEKKTQTNNS